MTTNRPRPETATTNGATTTANDPARESGAG